MQKIVFSIKTGQMEVMDMTPEEIAEIEATEMTVTEPVYPTENIMQDAGTGEPVKVVVKHGQVYVGGIDDETPSE